MYLYVYVHILLMIYARDPITSRGLAAGGAVFIRVRVPNLNGTTASQYGLVDLQLPYSSDREHHIPLSESATVFTLYNWYPHAPQPGVPNVDHQPTTRTRIQQACFLFFTNNFHTGA